MAAVTFSLRLCVEGHSESVLYRIPKGSVLIFEQSDHLAALGGVVELQFNLALSPDVRFERSSFIKCPGPGANLASTIRTSADWSATVDLHTAGSYQYKFTHRKRVSDDLSQLVEQSGYVVVEPHLSLPDGSYLPLDAIALQTVMAPMLGQLSTWRTRLQVAKESGYNMIHYSPIQQLGESQSAYSIAEQLYLLNETRDDPLDAGERPERLTTQSSVGKLSASMSIDVGFDGVYQLVKQLHAEWGMFSMVDVVWNHTASDSDWLRAHPEAGYNLKNSPHLKPAYELDRALKVFSREVAQGKWHDGGVSEYVRSEDDVRLMADTLRGVLLSWTRLWEYFSVDVAAQVDAFGKHLDGKSVDMSRVGVEKPPITIVQDPDYRRSSCHVSLDVAEDVLFHRDMEGRSMEEHINRAKKDLADTLAWLNDQKKTAVEQDIVREAIHNTMAHVRYEYLEHQGPRREKITVDHPIVPSYFFHVDANVLLSSEEVQDASKGERVLSHNGWMMDADPLANFAGATSHVYLRRQLIPWTDSCKLRFGERPEDSPWLWVHMTEYTRQMARVFHAFRIDNCHNTPFHVAEFMLDEARLVRPDLYVVAELFTNSEAIDNVFINRLGINSVFREAANAYNSKELGRLVHRFGGHPVGSFPRLPGAQPLKPTLAHALFVDLTHDNESLIKTRSVYDAMTNSALVAMACCATGSTRGYDELVPYQIGVVGGGRTYTTWSKAHSTPQQPPPPGTVDLGSGILAAKRALNELHVMLALQGYSQVYVDQVSEAVVTVTRHNPETHDAVVLVAHTCFRKMPEHEEPTEEFMGVSSYIPPLVVHGVIDKIFLEGRVVRRTHSAMQELPSDPSIIVGFPDFKVDLQHDISMDNSHFCELRVSEQAQEAHFHTFPPGSIIVFKTSLSEQAKLAVRHMKGSMSALTARRQSPLVGIVHDMSLVDINALLYRCDAEERDDGNGSGVYDVPRHGAFRYCGIQGVMSVMETVRRNNDLGHALCDNLRSGDWLVEYICNRLRSLECTGQSSLLHDASDALRDIFQPLSSLPRYLVPLYFQQLLASVHAVVIAETIGKMSPFVQRGSEFVRKLALGSVQLYGAVKSSPMPVVAVFMDIVDEHGSEFVLDLALAPVQLYDTIMPAVAASMDIVDDVVGDRASLAAGLPHFASGFMRCWGRDTFIALRGLMMVTGRLPEARRIILAFAACLRHGLIPNLLGGGPGARFNCRDAPWWFLQAIQDYCFFVGGEAILDDDVIRLFPTDESEPPSGRMKQTLSTIIQEIMQRHASGISFRERNAGPGIDMNMSDTGFNVSAGVDWKTGFPFGGSSSNCGTWMDKVGESDRARNRGAPATPRDGSAVEIVGLCKSTVAWLAKLHAAFIFPDSGVIIKTETKRLNISYEDWDTLILENFERYFWIPLSAERDVEREGLDAEYIHRRGIYKDTVGASQRFNDFQLRPNFPIAMVVAPDLFSPPYAVIALENVQSILNGPLGIATLDPKDWAYNGVYDNGVDSDDRGSSRGFNYHQGPEWLWIKGYFLRARLHFLTSAPSPRGVLATIRSSLSQLQAALATSEWQGLPELTNASGAECKDSCPVQAWTMSCLLDLLFDLNTKELEADKIA